VGDYFIAEINNQTYVFSLAGKRYTYYDTLVKSFQVMFYDISHYKPIDPAGISELELVTIKNDLPKSNMMMFNIFKILSKQEKHIFKPHKIADLKKYILEKAENQGAKEYVEQAQSIVNHLEHLKIDQIVTPLKRVTDYIEDELLATDPKFLGSLATAVLEADQEHKRINNVPIKSRTAWIKIMAVLMLVGLIGAVIYIAYDAGAFDGILDPLEGFSEFDFNIGGGTAPSNIMEKYPTPEALKAAIDRGEVDYSSLPPDVKKLVDSAPTPKADP
jgi:hypothetical protein